MPDRPRHKDQQFFSLSQNITLHRDTSHALFMATGNDWESFLTLDFALVRPLNSAARRWDNLHFNQKINFKYNGQKNVNNPQWEIC